LCSKLHYNPIIALGYVFIKEETDKEMQFRTSDLIHFWSDLQLKIYRDSYSKVHPVTISFDAIGGVCKKIKRYDYQLSGVIFLYGDVMNLFGESFTVLSMLSEKHEMFLFLYGFNAGLHTV